MAMRSGRAWPRSSRQRGPDLDLGVQGPVHRALVGDLEQPLSLGVGQVAVEFEFAAELVDVSARALAVGAVLRVNLAVADTHGHGLEIEILALGIQPERHTRAARERRREEVRLARQLFTWENQGKKFTLKVLMYGIRPGQIIQGIRIMLSLQIRCLTMMYM